MKRPVLLTRGVVRSLALLLCLLVAAPSFAADPAPVRARNGMVVSDEENASKAGIAILEQGGNAVDAAVATAFALAVTHPDAGNIGGGGFLLIRFHDGRSTFIDFRERAPLKATRDMYLDSAGEVIPGASTLGILAAGVPGTVAGMEYASRQYGRLSWAKVLEPAIRLAAAGFTLNEETARSLSSPHTVAKLSQFPESKRIFLRDGRCYRAGEVFTQTDLAATLRGIQRHGAKEFYEGETAHKIAAFFDKSHGLITLSDLKSYAAVEREPLRASYHGYQITTAPPPSSGGTALIEMLNILEPVKLREMGFGSADAIHWTVEAMRRAFADRAAYLGDTDFAKVPVKGLINREYADKLRASIDSERASSSAHVRAGQPARYEATETTHFSVVDKDGNAAALTYTLNGGYGNGMTVEGAGFLLNNEMDDFTSKPGVPNMFGLLQSEANAIAPRKHPLSAMTPTVVTRDGKLRLVTGSPGGPTIINTVLNILLDTIDYGMGVQQAVDAPRFHHQWMPDHIRMEKGLSPDTLALLRQRGYKYVFDDDGAITDPAGISVERAYIGDAHSIAVDADGTLLGAADPRWGGKAVGY